MYLGAVATLVNEPSRAGALHDAGHGIARRVRMVFATAGAEAAASVTVRANLAIAGGGALAAGSMLAVALGAAVSPGESLAAQGGALVANVSVGAVAAAEGTATAWAVAGVPLALTGVMWARRSGAR